MEDLPQTHSEDLLPEPDPMFDFHFPLPSESEDETQIETPEHISLYDSLEPRAVGQNVQILPAVSDEVLTIRDSIQSVFHNINGTTIITTTDATTETNNGSVPERVTNNVPIRNPPVMNIRDTTRNRGDNTLRQRLQRRTDGQNVQPQRAAFDATTSDTNINQQNFQIPNSIPEGSIPFHRADPTTTNRGRNEQGTHRNPQNTNPRTEGFLFFAREIRPSDEDFDDSDILYSFETTVYTLPPTVQSRQTTNEQTTRTEENSHVRQSFQGVLYVQDQASLDSDDEQSETRDIGEEDYDDQIDSNDDSRDEAADDDIDVDEYEGDEQDDDNYEDDNDDYDDDDEENADEEDNNDQELYSEEDEGEEYEEGDDDENQWTDIDSVDYQGDEEEDEEQEGDNSEVSETQMQQECNQQEDDRHSEEHRNSEHNANHLNEEGTEFVLEDNCNIIRIRIPPEMSVEQARLVLSDMFGPNCFEEI